MHQRRRDVNRPYIETNPVSPLLIRIPRDKPMNIRLESLDHILIHIRVVIKLNALIRRRRRGIGHDTNVRLDTISRAPGLRMSL
jgi:hypothetical protein